MLGILISLLGVNLSTTINYHSHYIPIVKEIVVEEEAETKPIKVEEPIKEAPPKYNINCSCVSYARQFVPDLPRGNADSFKANSNPMIGGIILLKYNVRHLAVIVDFKEEGILIKEANYKHCEETTRIIRYDDDAIVGFYSTLLDKKNNIMTEEIVDEVVDETPEVEEETTEEVEATEDEA